MTVNLSRQEALELLKKYNKEPFHIQHGLTVEGVMRYFARENGYGEDEEYWGIVGLLHDIDFELYPEQHCSKAPELLREAGVSEEVCVLTEHEAETALKGLIEERTGLSCSPQWADLIFGITAEAALSGDMC